MPSCTTPGTTTPTASTVAIGWRSPNSAASSATAPTTACAVAVPSSPRGVNRRARDSTVRLLCPSGWSEPVPSRAALISVPPTSTARSCWELATGTDLAPYRPLWSIPMGQSQPGAGRSGGTGHDLLECLQCPAGRGLHGALGDVGGVRDLRFGQVSVVAQHQDLALSGWELGQRVHHGLVFRGEHGEALRRARVGHMWRGVVAGGLAAAQHAA